MTCSLRLGTGEPMAPSGSPTARQEAFGRNDYRAGKDAVRTVRAGDLRSVGFVVEHTPRLGTAQHVSVFWPKGEWDDSVAELMDSQCSRGVV